MIVIIGGTSGIGLETGKHLKSLGYKTLIGGRNNPIKKNMNYRFIDVTDEASIKKFFQNVKRIDGLIYSTGITTPKKNIKKFDKNIWENIIKVNVTGALLTLKYSYEKLAKAKGKIVIINSFATRIHSELSGFEYTMSKTALSGMVKQLSSEFAKDSVLINSIFPSMTATSMLRNNIKQATLDKIIKEIPLKRIAKPIEVAKAIEFLISKNNSYMTGCGIDLSGGKFLNG